MIHSADESSNERCCYLHVGLPKTGTKTLQMGLLAKHSQIEYLGTYTGERRRYGQCRDATIYRLFNELLWQHLNTPNLPFCREIFQKSVCPAIDLGRKPVWSWESLMENNRDVQIRRAENLKAVFGNCRILVTLRHPLKLIESLYFQLLKRDNVGGRARFGKKVVYHPIDRWLAKNWGVAGTAPTTHLEYAEAIDVFADVFGDESVGIFLFEQLVEDPDEYVRSICRFIGVDEDEGVRQMKGRRENTRWSSDKFQRLQAIERSFLKSTLFRFSPRKPRRRILGFSDEEQYVSGETRARADLSHDWQQRILEKTVSGNQRIVRRWKTPLDKYGYPV